MVQNGMNKYCIGVEIGGTKQQIAVGTPKGQILEKKQVKLVYKSGASDILDWLKENINELLNKAPYKGNIHKIGVGFGGPLESCSGRVLTSLQVPGWKDFELKKWFEDTFNITSIIINDTVAGGIAELFIGNGQDSNLMFYTNIGTGIGGGIYINKEYFDGSGFGAAYLGNTLVPDWTSSNSSDVTRLELICSGKSIETRLRQENYIPKTSFLYEKCFGDTSKISCIDLAEGVHNNDEFSIDELNKITYTFSIGLANTLALVGIDKIVIGGGVANMGNILFDRIRKYTDELAFIANKNKYTIQKSKLMDDAVLYGALLIC